jgi:hypothetical protein
VHSENERPLTPEIIAEIGERNRHLANFKRVSGYLEWNRDFPLTASMKIKRLVLAEQIRADRERSQVVAL